MRPEQDDGATRSLRDPAAPPNIGAAAQPMERAMNEQDLTDAVQLCRNVLALAARSRAENQALWIICAEMMAEIALLDKSPGGKLAELTARVSGTAAGLALARDDSGDTADITRMIDEVCSTAEDCLAERQIGPG